MSIIVIEEGHPNGADLVTRGQPQGQVVQVTDLGDDFGIFTEPGIIAVKDGDEVSIRLVCAAGPTSRLVGIQPVPVVLGELARIPIANLRQMAVEKLQPKEAV